MISDERGGVPCRVAVADQPDVGVGSATDGLTPTHDSRAKNGWLKAVLRRGASSARLLFFVGAVGLLAFVESALFPLSLAAVIGRTGANEFADNVRAGTPGVIVGLVVALYIDVIRKRMDDAQQDQEQAQLSAQYLQTIERVEKQTAQIMGALELEASQRVAPIQLVSAALSRVYPAGSQRMDNLATALVGEPGTSPITQCSVRHRLSYDAGRPDYFVVERWQQLGIRTEQYVLAICAGDAANEAILFGCPSVTDSWNVGFVNLLDQNATLAEASTYIEVLPASRGFTPAARFSLKPIPKEEWSSLLSADAMRHADSIRLLGARVPSTNDALTVFTKTFLSRKTSYVYWSADLPTYVESFEFNFHDVKQKLGFRDFALVPFMGCASDALLAADDDDSLITRPRNWLVKGQGILLTWREALDAQNP